MEDVTVISCFCFQALVSVKRLQKFLNMEELDPDHVERTETSDMHAGNISRPFNCRCHDVEIKKSKENTIPKTTFLITLPKRTIIMSHLFNQQDAPGSVNSLGIHK